MSSKTELASRLQETQRIIEWAISRVPSHRLLEPPPHGKHPQSDRGFKTYFGEWSALRQLFHLAFYEGMYAVPAMQHCIGGPRPSADLVFPEPELEETAWADALAGGVDVASLLRRLRELRELQVDMLRDIPQEAWQEERVETGLGRVSAEFVVAKTVQHSLEHSNDLMKNALYWERALQWLDRQPPRGA
ncbi:MAG: DinB family protein [Acidobacteriota bacterium]